jgi:transcriptional regulator with XRE-family HTH domain
MLTVPEIERQRARLRIPKRELCQMAGVRVSTYARWLKAETSPQLRTLERVGKALETLKAEQAA